MCGRACAAPERAGTGGPVREAERADVRRLLAGESGVLVALVRFPSRGLGDLALLHGSHVT